MESKKIVVDLYIAPISDAPFGKVLSPLRQAQIDATVNLSLRRQRYHAWKLLEYALQRSLDLHPDRLQFSVDDQGKWHCGECFFSLSHCREAVAVAVSHAPIGVDIESTDRTVSEKLHKKILTPEEQAQYAALEPSLRQSYLLRKWCEKESLYKRGGHPVFSPRLLAATEQVCTGTATLSEKNFYYAVATDYPRLLRVYEIRSDDLWN